MQLRTSNPAVAGGRDGDLDDDHDDQSSSWCY